MLAVALAAAVACGPAHAHTLAASAQARVYEDGAIAHGCVRGKRPVAVGRHVTRVRLAGGFAAVVHSKALTVYDLRHRRVHGARRLNRRFSAVRGLALAETGVAAWIEDLPRHRRELRDSLSRTVDMGRNLDPAFVHLAGSVLGWMKSGEVKFAGVPGSMPAGSLGHVGGVELAASVGKLSARYLQGRTADLSYADALRVAGSVVATRDTVGGSTYVVAHDLVRGEEKRVCQTPQVTSYDVTLDGAVTCGANRIVITPAQYPCGPTHAGTFAMTDAARVYATGGRAYACRKGIKQSPVLGAAAPVRAALLNGDFTALRSAGAAGEELHVYSLASGRESGPGATARAFDDIQLSPAGVAVYANAARVGDTLGTTYSEYFGWGLRVVGGVVSWLPGKTGSPRQLDQLAHGAVAAPDEDGLLMRIDRVSIGVEHGRLVARLDGGAPVDMGAPAGIEWLYASGTFAETVDRNNVATRYDLATGAVQHPCPAPDSDKWC